MFCSLVIVQEKSRTAVRADTQDSVYFKMAPVHCVLNWESLSTGYINSREGTKWLIPVWISQPPDWATHTSAVVTIFGYFGWLPFMWASSPGMVPRLPAARRLQKLSWPHFPVLLLSPARCRWSDTGSWSSRSQQHIFVPFTSALWRPVRHQALVCVCVCAHECRWTQLKQTHIQVIVSLQIWFVAITNRAAVKVWESRCYRNTVWLVGSEWSHMRNYSKRIKKHKESKCV